MKTFRRHIRPRPSTVDGYRFPSQAEARRYGELKMMQHAGEIRNLEVHPTLAMEINGQKIGRGWIELDFRYEHLEDGEWITVWEDAKSVDTRESKLRRQVAGAIHGIEIRLHETG